MSGPFNSTGAGNSEPPGGSSRSSETRRRLGAEARERRCLRRDLCAPRRLAYGRPVTANDLDLCWSSIRWSARQAAASTPASNRRCGDPGEPEVPFRVETPPLSRWHRAGHGLGACLAPLLLLMELDSRRRAAEDREQNRLDQPAVLRATGERCSRTEGRALVDNFAAQWLRLRNLRSYPRSRATFPTSTTSCARRSDRDASSSRASSAKTGACSIC